VQSRKHERSKTRNKSKGFGPFVLSNLRGFGAPGQAWPF
jgi:hypothetical protein